MKDIVSTDGGMARDVSADFTVPLTLLQRKERILTIVIMINNPGVIGVSIMVP